MSKTNDEKWDMILTQLVCLRNRGVLLDDFALRTQVIEEVVPGQPYRSKRPGNTLTFTARFFDLARAQEHAEGKRDE